MGEAEQARVQGLTRKGGDPRTARAAAGDGAPGARAVDRIADHRVAAMGEMHPDLMGPAGGQTAFEERRLRVERALDTIARDRGFSPALPDNRHLLAVDGAAADIAGDLAGGRDRHTPDKGGIGTIDPARSKVARQCMMRGLGLGDDHQPARVLVEAMDDTRSANPADPGQAGPAMADAGR